MSAQTSYPTLANFIGGYFHQDWSYLLSLRSEPEEYSYVVDDVIKDESREYLIALCDDIVRLLASGAREAEIQQIILEDFGGYVNPINEGSTWRNWVEAINRRIVDHLALSLKQRSDVTPVSRTLT